MFLCEKRNCSEESAVTPIYKTVFSWNSLRGITLSFSNLHSIQRLYDVSWLEYLDVSYTNVKFIGNVPDSLVMLVLNGCPVRNVRSAVSVCNNLQYIEAYKCTHLVDKSSYIADMFGSKFLITGNSLTYSEKVTPLELRCNNNDLISASNVIYRFVKSSLRRIRATRVLQKYAHKRLWQPPYGLMCRPEYLARKGLKFL